MADRSDRMPTVVFVLFPSLETPCLETLNSCALRLKQSGYNVWIADEGDASRRLKALVMREIYDVGRSTAIVLTNWEGTWIDGWYETLPSFDELQDAAEKYRRALTAAVRTSAS